MRRRVIPYSKQELSWIEANKTRVRREAHADFCETFGRSDVSLKQYNGLCKRKGWMTGRTGQYKPGSVPANKGKKGVCAPGSEKGWFKKGERRGVAVELYKPVGTIRETKDGYLEQKIHDGMPLHTRWRAVHLVRWEELNGPIKKGHCLKCIDGNVQNTNPSNWVEISRSMLPRLSGRYGRGFEGAEPEVKKTILAVTRLEHKAKELKRGEA